MVRNCLSIVLAAGEGTRMKSPLPKVLHKIAGLPLVCHVIKQIELAGSLQLAVVVGSGAEDITKVVQSFTKNAMIFEQKERLGTAHAVLSARLALQEEVDDILIVFGDTPLIEHSSLVRIRAFLADGADVVVAGFYASDPTGYGRLIKKNGKLITIVEEKDASDEEKKVSLCNGGIMALNGKYALSLLNKIDNNNMQQEYYLTDVVSIASRQNLNIQVVEIPFDNVIGINNCFELFEADALWQKRKARDLMLSGVTILKPESVYFSYDTEIEPGVLIEPNVYFGPGVKIQSGAVIRAFSYLEGAVVGRDAQIGPYARLRFGTELERSVKVGNFCEIKQAKVGEFSKINHLSYIGDTEIGTNTNIGAGAITCNYDGFNKHKTVIDDDVFIGSNSVLVAPLSIGKGSYIASGSVITEDVPINSMVFGRARQVIKEDRAIKLRAHLSKNKRNK
ncbi:glmU protein [Bartonella bacilliformis Peru38]|uniref:Bifunctional protein GlmU n=2 Tax=Bartonella bacilliformis TaxID=774 RepID=GLMU_BARBK|nr:bifunctional UDP-N-acetylglucosamine diphosphorylase/glucosamine-1-phosphate N-acetyltransferase GlmU [Bartonella bacilliformis]A1USU8.1 RecName: Full=Bifunctional protein GlmU; Includes: RecName: Full=UDP-N-acetylglucosamine pyrophosphorylase; AltName: Full=N-acetylglucosamine-1-phosphate uridyltransferase; Includes: RecName: Full=Glucosamine-1-phosphate N-acetyltransferase [Bartonella bacilliformis KC583]ABM44579.1 putative UDP-N-acetylglucosamine pyrophosphorylase [Bartonella bacilliformis 